ncbi:hypothetical protein CsSME_00030752 [Camellia sinensis var. sinensis]
MSGQFTESCRTHKGANRNQCRDSLQSLVGPLKELTDWIKLPRAHTLFQQFARGFWVHEPIYLYSHFGFIMSFVLTNFKTLLKPQEEKTEEDRSKVDDLRGSPMSVGNLEELIDENHAIVSSSVGPEYYVGILSFVDKDQLEPGCAILMHNKVLSVVGLLQDEVDSMVSVMKVEKAPLESYADIGGLDAQIQEIKEAVELPLTHPELSEKVKLVSMGLSGGRLR